MQSQTGETGGIVMAKELLEKGIEKRTAVLGSERVQSALHEADDFNKPFQEAMTEWCWGFGWGDEVIAPRTRSMMNLTMIAALGRMHEWELHFNGAIANGVSKEELRAIIHVIAIYCGVPAGVECFRIARNVFAERGMA